MAIGYFKDFFPEDVAQTQFVANKQWTISTTTLHTSVLADSGSVVTGSEYYLATYSTASLNNFISGSSSEPSTADRYRFIIHSNIDHLFYRYNSRGKENQVNARPHQWIGGGLDGTMHRDLHRNAHVISIPQAFWGEGIKPKSVNFLDTNKNVRLKDDGFSNLYDVSITTSSMVGNENLVLHLPFSEGYKHLNPVDRAITLGSYYNNQEGFDYKGPFPYMISGQNIKFREGMHGYGLNLQGVSGSYVLANRQGDIKTEMGLNDEFAVSMWLKIPTSQSVSQSNMGQYENVTTWTTDPNGNSFEIRRRRLKNHNDNIIMSKRQKAFGRSSFPFEISIGNDLAEDSALQRNGKILFKRSDGVQTKVLSSSAQYNDNTWRHFLFQKTGSRLEMYCNGIRVAHKNDFNPNSGRTTISDSPLQIGGIRVPDAYRHLESIETDTRAQMADDLGLTGVMTDVSPYRVVEYRGVSNYVHDTSVEPMAKPFTGSMDEVRIYNQAIHSSSIAVLSSSITNTNKVGSIFYDYGILAITDPRTRYTELCQDHEKHYVNFQGSHTIIEEEYLCNIRAGDYELSMNPTLRVENTIKDENLKGIASSSDFSPYITTIGLYNDNFDLIATAKMASPLKKPKNMDATVVVRLDR